MEPIRSTKNSWIQRVRAVRAGKDEGPSPLLLVEGDRLVDDALATGLTAEVVLVDAGRTERIATLEAADVPIRTVESSLWKSVSSLVTAPGCLALVARPPEVRIEAAPEADLIVVVDGIQDPGNLGALARSAEAAGAGLLVVNSGGCSPWNPKALRGSMGSLLRLPVARVSDLAEARAALTARGFRHVLAATRGGQPPEELDCSGPLALWFTAETGALSEPQGADGADFQQVSIPLAGAVESLNVTTAAAVLLFHIARERRQGIGT